MNREHSQKQDIQGFTLIELMISMLIGVVMLGCAFYVQQSQQKAFHTQEQVAALQQNLRAAKYMLVKDIRMAGYDPTGDAGASFVSADSDSVRFTLDASGSDDGMDNDGDGQTDEVGEVNSLESDPDGNTDDPNEDVKYFLSDTDGDGTDDALVRLWYDNIDNDGDGNIDAADEDDEARLIAENVDVLNLVYLDEDDNVIATPITGMNLNQIRSVQVAIVARTEKGEKGFTNPSAYTNLRGAQIYSSSDSYRRRVITMNIECRNFGL